MMTSHDRITHPNPHTPLGQDPLSTDWDSLLPLAIGDENLTSDVDPAVESLEARTPMISGFIYLVKVFLCMLGLASSSATHQVTSSPAASPSASAISMISRAGPLPVLGGLDFRSPQILFQTMEKLEMVLTDIPDDLNILRPADSTMERFHQFEIMKANIHITKLYLQSWILDRYLLAMDQTTNSKMVPEELPGVDMLRYREMWKSWQEDIARQALQVLTYCSQSTLESHGGSMVINVTESSSYSRKLTYSPNRSSKSAKLQPLSSKTTSKIMPHYHTSLRARSTTYLAF